MIEFVRGAIISVIVSSFLIIDRKFNLEAI